MKRFYSIVKADKLPEKLREIFGKDYPHPKRLTTFDYDAESGGGGVSWDAGEETSTDLEGIINALMEAIESRPHRGVFQFYYGDFNDIGERYIWKLRWKQFESGLMVAYIKGYMAVAI